MPVPEGYHVVRRHIRRNPRPSSAKKMSVWTIAGVCALVWLWAHFIGFGDTGTATSNTPAPTASAPAVR
ncbi:hypothetical protein KV557_23175 [Kitasatospora aureofaciens]|uniref:hypothetical protein n=1 Tax=Kitasatospora aureofaciens TaxID=1894 RepID=UPI001C45C1D8|nr:hypothetical protein [Kitasatospora aureofaciens]MBV6699969.1 hypothetical protein [Kitasatospora aureofaciens]